MLQKQTQLLLQQQALTFKKPTIFYAGTGLDAAQIYAFSDANNPSTLKWANMFGLAYNVYVFNCQDADEIEVNLKTAQDYQTSIYSVIMAIALSPNDVNNQIPSNQFTMVDGNFSFAPINAGQPYVLNCNLTDRVRCAGNKYIHIFAVNPGAFDAMAGANDPADGTSIFTYRLYK